jgi:hypothetical protein
MISGVGLKCVGHVVQCLGHVVDAEVRSADVGNAVGFLHHVGQKGQGAGALHHVEGRTVAAAYLVHAAVTGHDGDHFGIPIRS